MIIFKLCCIYKYYSIATIVVVAGHSKTTVLNYQEMTQYKGRRYVLYFVSFITTFD